MKQLIHSPILYIAIIIVLMAATLYATWHLPFPDLTFGDVVQALQWPSPLP